MTLYHGARSESKSQFVNVYDFVHQNRRGIYNGKMYDLAVGPVANDDVFTALLSFGLNGIIL